MVLIILIKNTISKNYNFGKLKCFEIWEIEVVMKLHLLLDYASSERDQQGVGACCVLSLFCVLYIQILYSH